MKESHNFIDLSFSQYNRHTHDHFSSIEVAEINFIVSLSSIIASPHDREIICSLVTNNSIDTLFDEEVIEAIKEFDSEDDYVFPCRCTLLASYEDNEVNGEVKYTNNYIGADYYILRHLKDRHICQFEDDVASNRLKEVMKVEVGKDKVKVEENLIIKVYPTKSSYSGNPVSYTISLLYLLLFSLYKKLRGQDTTTNMVFKEVFTYIRPIVAKVVYSVTIKANDNYPWFNQLRQLESAYKFFSITKDENQVKFMFRPREDYLLSTLWLPVNNDIPSDTNFRARFVECNYTLGKDNLLTCKTTIISKDMVDCIFLYLLDEDEEHTCLYSRLSDNEYLYLIQYEILNRLLSFTKQHEELKENIEIEVEKDIKAGKHRLVFEPQLKDKIKMLSAPKTISQAFQDIEVGYPYDILFEIAKQELLKLKQKNDLVLYLIVILRLFKEEDSVIKEKLASRDKKTADKIKKVIRKLRRLKPASCLSLNDFYKGYLYA